MSAGSATFSSQQQKMVEAQTPVYGCAQMADEVRAPLGRRALTQTQFQQQHRFVTPPHKSGGQMLKERVREACTPSTQCLGSALTQYLPILGWLPQYDFKNDLFGDVIAGVTTAIMHIPQGMAYAMLARIPPIHGIYMAFFQCLIYVILGTSRHVSVGTFAVVCIMTGKVVTEYSEVSPDVNGIVQPMYDPVVVASTVAMAVGLIELAMFLLRMGALTVVLSDMLVKGFTTGAAVHVLMSQVKSLFGLTLPRYSGPGKLIKSFVAILTNAFSANPAAMVISGTAISVLVLNNEFLKPKVAKRTRFPVPIELVVVILGTVASYCGDLSTNYNVHVIGNVTTGLPLPIMPDFSLMPSVLMDAVIIAIIGYSVGLSMSQLFAKKHEYVVDANQELVAYGVGNVVSSFFSCAPMSASLSRSLILEGVGGKTQASGIVTSGLLLVVLLWLGPVFSTLPNCVLSSIIVVSLKGMFMQFADLKQVWKTSRADALIWFITFITVVAADIDIGLAVGVAVSIAVLLLRNQKPSTALLGNVPSTDIYLDVSRYHAAHEELDMKIFQFGGPLHFCNRDFFREEVIRLTGLDPIQYKSYLTKMQAQAKQKASKLKKASAKKAKRDLQRETAGSRFYTETCIEPGCLEKPEKIVVGIANDAYEPDSRSSTMEPLEAESMLNGESSGDDSVSPDGSESYTELQTLLRQNRRVASENGNSVTALADVEINLMFSTLILDMSSVGFVDTASTRSLLSLIKDYQSIQISCYLVACNEDVLRMVRQCGCTLDERRFYSTVQDAVKAVRCRDDCLDSASSCSELTASHSG